MTTDHPAGTVHIAPAGTDPHDPTAWTEVGYAGPTVPVEPTTRFEFPTAVVLNLRGTFDRIADALAALGRSFEALFGHRSGFRLREQRRQRRADPTRIRVSRMHAAYHRRTR